MKRLPTIATLLFLAATTLSQAAQVGPITFYGKRFQGRETANGERFNRHAMTLASRTLPFGTRVRVTNLKNGRSVIGRVNDRGPFVRGRIADLSQGMAKKIGFTDGIMRGKIEVLSMGRKKRHHGHH